MAVFGASEALPGEPLYELAREVGRLLARAGFRVVTGGYGGVMEGASRGALEAGGTTLGVVTAAFSGRTPNPYLSAVDITADLHERTRHLIESAQAYIVLPGKTGTLAEAALVWALLRSESLRQRRVVLLGPSWRRILATLEAEGMLDGVERAATRWAATPEDAVRALDGRR